MVNKLMIAMALLIGVGVYSHQAVADIEFQSINACVMKKFCDLGMRKCSKRCRLQVNEKLFNCINQYRKVSKYATNLDDLKTKWLLNCRIEKLKSLYVQSRALDFGDNESAVQQKKLLIESIKSEMDQRFEKFYEMP